MALIGYARVSTLDQQFKVQQGELKVAGCKTIFEEKASGGKRDRPVLRKMLSTVQPGDTVVVVRMDRLARSLVDLLSILDKLRAKGVEFRSLNDPIDTTTSHGMLQLQIMGAVAEFERRLIRERVLAGMALARAQGRTGGNPKLMAGDPEALADLQKRREEAYLRRALSDSDKWMPIVRRLRAEGKHWHEVVEVVNETAMPPGAERWNYQSLRRAVRHIAGNDPALWKRAPAAKPSPNIDKALRIVAGLVHANPEITLKQIGHVLDEVGIPTARGKPWFTSSVARLVRQATISGLTK